MRGNTVSSPGRQWPREAEVRGFSSSPVWAWVRSLPPRYAADRSCSITRTRPARFYRYLSSSHPFHRCAHEVILSGRSPSLPEFQLPKGVLAGSVFFFSARFAQVSVFIFWRCFQRVRGGRGASTRQMIQQQGFINAARLLLWSSDADDRRGRRKNMAVANCEVGVCLEVSDGA